MVAPYKYFPAPLRRFLLPAACLLLGVAQAHAGLVLHYKFDETSGTTATDSSGSGNTGTLTNMAGSEWTTGKVGGALDFDGTNDYVNLGSVASADPLALASSAFTMAAWINTPLTGDIFQRIVSKATDFYGVDGYEFAIGNAGRLRLYVNGNDFRSANENIVGANTWTHVAVTADGSNYQFYVNGVAHDGEFSTGSYNAPPSVTANANVGRQSAAGVRRFNGSMDELRIYNSALSASEIGALAGAAPEPAETFAFLGLLTAAGLGFREWRSRRKAKAA